MPFFISRQSNIICPHWQQKRVITVEQIAVQGDILVVFRGREMAHKEIGSELLDKVLGLIGDDIVVEGKAQFNGRNLSVGIRKK